MASAMEHQATLLLGRLDLDEPHRCSGDGLADRLVTLPPSFIQL
jgi:hypothetical protein